MKAYQSKQAITNRAILIALEFLIGKTLYNKHDLILTVFAAHWFIQKYFVTNQWTAIALYYDREESRVLLINSIKYFYPVLCCHYNIIYYISDNTISIASKYNVHLAQSQFLVG